MFVQMPAAAAPAVRPNIVIIMSDDMGYSDIGCFGGEIETPNLDALAQGGLRFTRFYNTARCCPTRASLLTGLYPHQAGIGHMVDAWSKRGGPGYAGDLNRRCLTIAEVLKAAGYRTYAAGKWHVTPFDASAPESDKRNWPLQRGFDRYYGTISGAGSFYDPASLTRDNTLISPFADPDYRPAEYFYTDAITDNATRFLDDHRERHPDQPFFLYVAHTAAHWPLHAKEADIAKYKGRYDAGYDAVRAARLEKMKRLGLLDPRWTCAPQAGGAWKDVKNRGFEIRCMEVYAAMVDCLDQNIGRLVAGLKRNGQYENTIILFLQDNGGCAETLGRKAGFELRAERPTLPPLADAHVQMSMVPGQTRDGYPVRMGYGVMPGPADTYIAYGEAWANVSNTPFREYKHWVHEGGISTPLIAHWPAGIAPSRHNALVPHPGHVIDLMATCVDLGNASYPQTHAGEAVQPPEGTSLRPAFAGKPLARKEPIFFEHEGNRAVIDGDWKLVAKGPAGAWELYDMAGDRTETRNLAMKEPQRVRAMTAQWEAWAKRANVLPWTSKPAYKETSPPEGAQ